MNSRWYRRTISCLLSAVIIIPVNTAFIPCNNMTFVVSWAVPKSQFFSRQISILFTFNSVDNLYGTYLATKNLRPISSKTHKIVVFGMNNSLAISRHEAWRFLFEYSETASERLSLDGLPGRSSASTDILQLRKRAVYISTVRWQRASFPYTRLSLAWIAVFDFCRARNSESWIAA
jgi:hypothetical protein